MLSDRKRLLLQTEIHRKEVPKFKEFTVDAAYTQCAGDAEVMSYLPDLTMAKRMPDREYVYDIMNTLKSDYLK